ncbi:MAG: YlbF family regulator [Anaerolineaceae bacterium]
MVEPTWNDLEVASREVVMKTARLFAEAFSETPQFLAFEQAYLNFRNDPDAQNALQAFQKKQASLKALRALNAVSDEDRQELQRLQEHFYHQSSVIQYIQSQEELVAMSQEMGDLLSRSIGLDYGNSCKTGGCCG